MKETDTDNETKTEIKHTQSLQQALVPVCLMLFCITVTIDQEQG